jgi:hypothetical protein
MTPIIRQKRTGGRKPNQFGVYLRNAYGLTPKQLALAMPIGDQLARCASDCARRLLLGVSEQFAKPVSRVAEKVRRVA